MDYSFPKELRIRKKKEFEAVYERGAKKIGKFVIVHLLENNLGYPRLGITVSKKLGKAYVRNRWKRLIREIFRLNKQKLPPMDIVITVKKGYKPPKYKELEEDILLTIVTKGEKNESQEINS